MNDKTEAFLQLPYNIVEVTFTPDLQQYLMTALLLNYVGKRICYAMMPFLENKNIEFSFNIPVFEQDIVFKCTCCSWKGSEDKTKKYYLHLEQLTELEHFCPKCGHYLGFTTI